VVGDGDGGLPVLLALVEHLVHLGQPVQGGELGVGVKVDELADVLTDLDLDDTVVALRH